MACEPPLMARSFLIHPPGVADLPDCLQCCLRHRRRDAKQVDSRKGDLILRDMRVWHCGMPNRTGTPRVMLAMIHRPHWAIKWGFEAESGAEEFFDHPVLGHTAVFLDRPIDYLHQGHSQPMLTSAKKSGAST